MKAYFTGLAFAAILIVGPTLPSHAEDAAAPSAPAATSTEAPPSSVPRPSIAPKTAEPAPASAPAATATEPEARPHRRYARHWHRYGYYRTAYWEPFPIYVPHLYHNRIHWGRIPWQFRF